MSAQTKLQISSLARYGLAVAAVGAAFLLHEVLSRLIAPDSLPYVTYYPAVMVVATLAGGGPGLLATALLALLTAYRILPPPGRLLPMGRADAIGLGVFAAMGAFISLLAELWGRAQQRATAYLSDLTAGKAAEAALRATEEFNRRLFASSYDCIKVLDLDLNLLSMNEGGRRLMEIDDVGRYLNAPYLNFWNPEDWPTIRQALATAQGGGVGRFQGYSPSVRGTPRWWDVRITPIPGTDSRPERLLVIARDTTDTKKTEEALAAAKLNAERAMAAAEEANHAKDHFLAVLSHELRTPLTPVLAELPMLQAQSGFDAETQQTLEMIRRNVELEARLIDDLLDVTRIARGKIELDKRPVELCDVIGRAVEVCQADIEARGLHFGVDLGDAGSATVLADPGRLQQVFWNLLKNAIKFTPRGGCVGVRCRRENGDAGRMMNDGEGRRTDALVPSSSLIAHPSSFVVVEVNDSGEGIDPALLPHVFRPFEQGGAGITRQFGGLGLGLTITRGLVEMHGGTIEARSEGKGKGASFVVKLALHQKTETQTPAGRPRAPSRPRALRILLVEDHGDTARAMRRLLTADGHDVQTAGDVATALELVRACPFDLLISDLGLPDRSGLDLMRELRSLGRTVPGIALSGYGQEEDVARSREAGFAAHLLKPTNPARLADVIASVSVPA